MRESSTHSPTEQKKKKRRAARGKNRRERKKKKGKNFLSSATVPPHLSFSSEREGDLEAERRPQVKGGPVFWVLVSACKERTGFFRRRVERHLGGARFPRNSSVFSFFSPVAGIAACSRVSRSVFCPSYQTSASSNDLSGDRRATTGEAEARRRDRLGSTAAFVVDADDSSRSVEEEEEEEEREEEAIACVVPPGPGPPAPPPPPREKGRLVRCMRWGPRSRAALVGLALWARETAMREEKR